MVILGKDAKQAIFMFLLFWLASFQINAEQFSISSVKAEGIPAIASLVASPNSCKLEPSQEICEMEFHIIWETPSKGDFCLFEENDYKPKKCWQDVQRGSIELPFIGHILKEYKVYRLKNSKTKRVVATLSVSIKGTLKQKQRAQRRRRGFWRMF